MTMRLKSAIITGAAQGLGAAIATAYAETGMSLALMDVKVEPLTKLADKLQHDFGVEVYCVPVDLSNAEETRAAANVALTQIGTPRVLVHNAAILINRPLMAIDFAAWQRETSVILQAAFLLTQAVWDGMVGAGGGNLIYVSSRSGVEGFLDESPYVAGKHALEGFMKCMAMEGAPHHIAANTITPGMYMRTPMSEYNYSDDLKQKWVDPALLTPAFVALAGQTDTHITGQRLNAWSISEAMRSGDADPFELQS